MESLNPYLPPQADLRNQVPPAEGTRRLHRDHENGLKGLALLMFCCGAMGVWGLGLAIFQQLKVGTPAGARPEAYVWLLISLGFVVSSMGLFGLRRWAWWSVLGLESLVCAMILLPKLSFSWAALFHGAIALSLLQPKTRHVVTAEYRKTMVQTAHVRRRTSAVGWVLMGLLAVLFSLVILAALFGW